MWRRNGPNAPVDPGTALVPADWAFATSLSRPPAVPDNPGTALVPSEWAFAALPPQPFLDPPAGGTLALLPAPGPAPPGPDLLPGAPRPCALSGGSGPYPSWLFSARGTVAPAPFSGYPVDPERTTRLFFNPRPTFPSDLHPRGLTLAPHTAGLLVKAVWGWAATEGGLTAGDVITEVGDQASADRAVMVTRLSAQGGGSCHLSVALNWLLPGEWAEFPADLDVSL